LGRRWEENMTKPGFDLQTAAVLTIGWLVALITTLT
jgi:hypothetical protein